MQRLFPSEGYFIFMRVSIIHINFQYFLRFSREVIILLIHIMLLFSCLVKSYPLWPHGLQHIKLPCHFLSPEVCSNSCPWVDDIIPPSCPLLPSSPLALSHSQHQGLFANLWTVQVPLYMHKNICIFWQPNQIVFKEFYSFQKSND